MAEPYKYQWARSVARKTLAADLEAIRKNMEDTGGMNEFLGDIGGEKPSVAQLVRRTKELTGTGPALPKEPGQMKMGIVGAGVAGLFTAMVFDWLNSQFLDTELSIDYDIFEAGPENRLGGRLYTHHFSERPHDYYDVGAMRFPNNNVMKRTFQLFELLRQPEDKEKLKLLPYYLDDLENVCPSYFNDVQKVGKVWPEDRSVTDPYKINSGLPEDSQIPEEILKENPSDLVSRALAGFIGVTAQLFEEFRAWIKATEKGEKWKPREDKRTPEQAWWDHLMKSDNMSVRQFLRSGDNGIGFPRGPEYNYNTIEWLETATYGTGWYDQALSECVLEELDFETPKDKCQYWWCVDGGSQEVAKLMAKKIKKKVQFNSQITAIDAQIFERKKPGMRPQDHVPMKLKIKDRKAQDYFAIFNSTTLAALQRMDLKDAGLLYGTKQAIRALGYGASCKVAIKFRTPWWQLEPFKISMGGVARTDLPLRVCVYPSYNIEKVEGEHWDPDGSSVLLCSYTWGQDAQRLGSLISNDTPKNEEELKRVLLHNLALLHADPNINVTENPTAKNTYDNLLSHLYEQYETHHAWDWYRDQNMSGAFAYYGPGQFSNMWQEILKPNSFAQLYLVGEAASSHHAWIVGALESVIRAIYVLFEGLENSNEDDNYEVYQQVMNLLEFGQKERPTDEEIEKSREVEEKQKKEDKKTKEETGEVPFPKGLPFFPLPAEMPKRQGFTKRGKNVTHSPEKAAKNEGDLAWPAAAAALSMLEAFFELVYETEKDVKRAKENVEKAKSRGVDAGTSTDE